MSITLRNIKVWNTGEVIDLVVPGTAAAYFADTSAVRVALDQDLSEFSASLTGVREVAFFPPMTGG